MPIPGFPGWAFALGALVFMDLNGIITPKGEYFDNLRSVRLAMTHYKSNLRDLEFNLFEVFGAAEVLGAGPYADLDGDTWPPATRTATVTRRSSIRRRLRRRCWRR
jgi:hypothetical protein